MQSCLIAKLTDLFSMPHLSRKPRTKVNIYRERRHEIRESMSREK